METLSETQKWPSVTIGEITIRVDLANKFCILFHNNGSILKAKDEIIADLLEKIFAHLEKLPVRKPAQ